MEKHKTPLEVNKLTVTDTKDSKEKESPDKELKSTIIGTINEIKRI
jgi:hypothetical protein